MCVSGEVTREVLDKCKVLSADTGHHNDTVLPWNVCCFLFQCTQQNLRPALYQTSAQMYLTHTRTHTEEHMTLEKRTKTVSSPTLPIHCMCLQVIWRDKREWETGLGG